MEVTVAVPPLIPPKVPVEIAAALDPALPVESATITPSELASVLVAATAALNGAVTVFGTV